jgi:uncharacterized protein YcnI
MNQRLMGLMAGAGLALAAAPASAHVVLQKWTAYAGYQEYVTLAVPHGCGDSPTTEIRVRIPEGITIVVPEDKPGWTTKIVKRKLPAPVSGEGGTKISEVIDEIAWSGGSLGTDRLGLFTMLARMPDAPPGTVLFFKTIQTCAKGETRWVDTIPAGEPAWKIWAQPAPSPFLELEKPPGPQLGATMQQIGAERAKRGGGRGAK